MTESQVQQELRALRGEIARMVTAESYTRHESLDESRHISNTSRLTALEVSHASAQADLKGYIRGRAAVMGAVLAIVIPFLTLLVNVWLAPHGSGKL